MTEPEPLGDRQKWEYRMFMRKTQDFFTNELNELGKSGWELVSVIYHKEVKSTGTFMAWSGFMKRPFAHESETDRAAEGGTALQSAQRFETAELDDKDIEFKFQDADD